MASTNTTNTNVAPDPNHIDIDPIWTTSRTARQIYALGEVEKDISRLLSLAASSISLLTLPQTDGPDDNLPQGEERSEQFVLEISEYFARLDTIQGAIRSSLAHIRHSRIAPSAINAPPLGFVPPSLGVGSPPSPALAGTSSGAVDGSTASVPGTESAIGAGAAGTMGPGGREPPRKTRGLQEERIERDAWKGILDALTRLKLERERERDLGNPITGSRQ